MSSSRLSKIVNTTGTEIKVANLKDTQINSNDISSVKNLLKNLRNESIAMLFICFLFFIFISFLSYYTLKNSSSFLNKELVLIIAFMVSFMLVFLSLGRKIYCINNYNYKKGQYGVVKSKYILKTYASENSISHFYINVFFKDTNTSIKNVICKEKIYNSISENTEVLVITFDNKTSYALKANKNNY